MNNPVKKEKKKLKNKKRTKILIPRYGLDPEDVHNVVNQLNEWADKPDSYTIIGFAAFLNIDVHRYYDWVDKYPELYNAHKVALGKIQNRLITGGLTRQLDSQLIRHLRAGLLDRDLRKDIEWESRLRIEEEKKEQQVIVMLDGIQINKPELDNNR
jgi:hypothetical protein